MSLPHATTVQHSCVIMSDATVLLAAAEQGDSQASDQLLNLVYDELRQLAAYKLGLEAPGQTLQPTALVHEVWLKLVGVGEQQFKNRAHFFAVAAEAMRRILIDRARRRKTHRHGGQYNASNWRKPDWQLQWKIINYWP